MQKQGSECSFPAQKQEKQGSECNFPTRCATSSAGKMGGRFIYAMAHDLS
jgi:hypothetical protein